MQQLLQQIRITNQTAIKNSEIGGYYDIIYINANGRDHRERFFEITGDESQFLKETVIAYDNRLISKEVCYSLVDKLVFGKAEFDLSKAENFLFSNACDSNKLELLLRGYKI